MDFERVKTGEADRPGIVFHPGVLIVKRRQITADAQEKSFIIATGLTKFLEGLLFHGRAFIRRKIAALQRNNFLGQRFQVKKILLIPSGCHELVHTFNFHRAGLHRLTGEKRAAAG